MPMLPVISLASSDRMSPNIFSVTITSNWAGFFADLHGAVVHEHLAVLHLGVLPLPAGA